VRRFRVMTPREWHQPRMHAAREVNDLKQSVLITYSTEPMSIIFGPWLRHGLGPEKQLDIGNNVTGISWLAMVSKIVPIHDEALDSQLLVVTTQEVEPTGQERRAFVQAD
jgi:hypothetical protein